MPILNREKEREIVQKGIQNGYSEDDIKNAIIKFRKSYSKQQQQQTPEVKSPVKAPNERVGSVEEFKGLVSDVGGTIKERGTRMAETLGRDDLNLFSKATSFIGDIAGGTSDLISDVAGGAIQLGTPEFAEKSMKSVGGAIMDKILSLGDDNPIVKDLQRKGIERGDKSAQELWSELEEKNPNTAETLRGLANSGMLAAEIYTLGQGKTLSTGVKELSKPLLDVSKKGYSYIDDITERAYRAKNYAFNNKNIKKNIEKAAKEEFNSLDELGKSSVKSGVDVKDVIFLNNNLDSIHKPLAKEMVENASRFAEDNLLYDPAKVVGDKVLDKYKDLKSLKSEYGKKLDAIASSLPKVNKGDIMTPETKGLMKKKLADDIIKPLTSTPGFSGIKYDPKTFKLIFDDTTLSTDMLASDKKVIQKAFNDVINTKDPSQLHKKRQGLLKFIGGAGQKFEITQLQRNAINSMRQGMSDVLDGLNSEYKNINKYYSEIAKSLGNVDNWFKGLDDAPEDLLKIRSSNLARRITSYAKSKPEILDHLRKADDVLKYFEKGSAKYDIAKLQQILDKISKYYDISGNNSLGGILGSVRGIPITKNGMFVKILESIMGQYNPTEQTAQHAIKQLLSK